MNVHRERKRFFRYVLIKTLHSCGDGNSNFKVPTSSIKMNGSHSDKPPAVVETSSEGKC